MDINTFLREKRLKEELKNKDNKKKNQQKDNFQEKCMDIINKIIEIDKEKGLALKNVFTSSYSNVNIQKKKLLGFYGQIVNEYKTLKMSIPTEISQEVKKVANVIEEKMGEIKEHVEAKVMDKLDKAVKVVKKVKAAKAVKKVTKVTKAKTAKVAKKKSTKVVAKKKATPVAKNTKKTSKVTKKKK